MTSSYLFFFFQAEDGIRDLTVTGVQTCALLRAEDGIRDLTVTGVQTCALPISRAAKAIERKGRKPAACASPDISWFSALPFNCLGGTGIGTGVSGLEIARLKNAAKDATVN